MSAGGARAMIIHASSVALSGRGVIILGASGSGKSGLALNLMALGCDLVSDDRTAVAARDGVLLATAPVRIRDRIEARGVGILAAKAVAAARVVLAVDLDETETERLPPWRTRAMLGAEVPLLHRVDFGGVTAVFPHWARRNACSV